MKMLTPSRISLHFRQVLALLCAVQFSAVTGAHAAGSDQTACVVDQTGRALLLERAKKAYSRYEKQVEKYRVTSLAQFLEGRARLTGEQADQARWLKVRARIGASLRDFGRYFIPFRPKFLSSPLEKIADKQWKNFDYEPTPEELDLLKSTNNLARFNGKKAYLKAHPNLGQARRVFETVRNGLILGFLINSLEETSEAAHHSVTAKDFERNDEYQLKDDEIQFLDEGIIPHLALRIGKRVFSYGVHAMEVSPISEYLHDPRVQPKEAQAIKEKNPGLWARILRAYDRVPRTVRALTLRLPKDEVLHLKRALEMDSHKVYKNITLVHDCSTMIAKALNANTPLKIPAWLDASPAMMMTYLRMAYADRVTSFRYILMDEKQNVDASATLTATVTFLEERAYLSTVSGNFAYREFFEHHYSEKEISDWDEATRKSFREYAVVAHEQVSSDATTQGLQIEIDPLTRNSSEVVVTRVAKEVKSETQDQEDEAAEISRSLSSDFTDIMLYQAIELEWRQERLELLKSIELKTGRSLSDP